MYYIGQTFAGMYPVDAADWCNENGARIDDINGVWTIVSAEPTPEERRITEINELKMFLSDTDYVVIKIAEGVATPEDYADVIAQRQSARARIRELEA